jgi:hypothetical protein
MVARLFAKFITYTAIIGLILAIAGEVPSAFTNTSELIRIHEVAKQRRRGDNTRWRHRCMLMKQIG